MKYSNLLTEFLDKQKGRGVGDEELRQLNVMITSVVLTKLYDESSISNEIVANLNTKYGLITNLDEELATKLNNEIVGYNGETFEELVTTLLTEYLALIEEKLQSK